MQVIIRFERSGSPIKLECHGGDDALDVLGRKENIVVHRDTDNVAILGSVLVNNTCRDDVPVAQIGHVFDWARQCGNKVPARVVNLCRYSIRIRGALQNDANPAIAKIHDIVKLLSINRIVVRKGQLEIIEGNAVGVKKPHECVRVTWGIAKFLCCRPTDRKTSALQRNHLCAVLPERFEIVDLNNVTDRNTVLIQNARKNRPIGICKFSGRLRQNLAPRHNDTPVA